MSNISEKFMEISGKIGSQRHLIAIRDSFISMMPITMAGTVAVLLNVFLRDIPTNMGWTSFVEAMQPIININGYVYFGTIGIMALVFAFTFGYNLSLMYKVNPLAGGLISFASFISTIPQSITISTALNGADKSLLSALEGLGLKIVTTNGAAALETSEWGAIALKYGGATGLFTALLIGFLATWVYASLVKRNVAIKLPDSVPPAVNKAFAAIIPGTAAVYASSIIAYLAFALTGQSLGDLVSTYIQLPLLGLSQGLGSVVLLTFLVQLFWFFGLHGHNVLAPIMDGIYGVALNENAAAYTATQSAANLPWLWTRGSFDAYAQMGGSGVTLALIIAIFIFSKREEHKMVAKLSAPMGVFNINEPIIFGVPMVLNPLFVIPWLIVPPICAAIAYLATAAGLIPPVFAPVPWITPPGLYAYLATGGNVMAALVSLFNLLIAFLIWTPFVIAANRVKAGED
ncbi:MULTISPECIES: PTS sugar transporter subunit IIC [Streptococcus]|uniref:Permease IIC component n=1 Tax=Streptococcus ruminantium TaxID=1917441 RepID=A0A2Z5TT59_9STRE|nr:MULTISPECIES: PTS transporter subunit EIIC [Streptococcus]MDQ8764127.1 PTS transporter subunit EIIC [Streptococcus ruminantium]MDQ8766968.1 PTS transporter subunit EIIC [Streptococcus ruminantium]MDQ8779796.1 PTS transporter subunit EIIC [Streptococcus ruminantium]MDQ8837448.1 PTS transporter subunit EIIC [Streptococcus ruminantium]QHF55540.1 PTS cellobiose transporter subunit IIC [Streptococcus sp. DAT741]